MRSVGGATNEVVVNTGVTVWVVVIFILLVFGIVYAWRWYVQIRLWRKYIDCSRCYKRYTNAIMSCTGRKLVPYHQLKMSGSAYTYCIWVYIADWYAESFKQWKCLFYRGERLPSVATCPTLMWDTPKSQGPGIWLGDVQNNLRVVINTRLTLPASCVDNLAQEDLPGDAETEGFVGSAGAGSAAAADTINWDARPPGYCHRDKTKPRTKSIDMADYVELRNIPIGRWFHVVTCVQKREVELYLDGMLHRTKVLVGEPDFRKQLSGYFSPRHGFRGRFSNFRFMPHRLPSTMVKSLYDAEYKMSFRSDPNPLKERMEEADGE